MAKNKNRTKKQKANDRRLGRMAKSQAKSKKRSVSRSTKPKVIRVAKNKRRRSNKQAKKGFADKLMSRLGTPIAAIGYGFFRERISDALAKTQLVKNLPATEFTDEAVMLVGTTLGKRFLGNNMPILRRVLNSAQIIEWSRVGETLSDMQQKGTLNVGGSVAANAPNESASAVVPVGTPFIIG